MDVIEGRDLFNIWLSDLADDLFLLFSKLSWVDNGLLDRFSRLDWSRLWRVLFLFLSLFLEFGELPEFFIFFPLLFGIDVCLDDLGFGLGGLRLGLRDGLILRTLYGS